MSLYIYNVYKLKEPINDIFEFNEFMQNFKKNIQIKILNYIKEDIANRFIYVADKKTMSMTKENVKSIFSKVSYQEIAYNWIQNWFNDKDCYRCHIIPFENNLYFSFSGLYAKEALEYIEDTFDDYHYDNRVDKPKNIDENDWTQREHVWTSIRKRKNQCNWTEVGLNIELFPDGIHKPIYFSDVADYIPKMELRIESLASQYNAKADDLFTIEELKGIF